MKTKFESIYCSIKQLLNDIKTDFGYEYDSTAFGHYIIKLLFDVTDEDASEAITDGPNDNGIDAVFFDGRDNSNTLHLFQFKFPESEDKINKSLSQSDILKFINGYEHFVGNDSTFCSINWNDLLKEKRREISSKNIVKYKLHFLRFTTESANIDLLKKKINVFKTRTGFDIECEDKTAKDITYLYEKSLSNTWPDFSIKYKKDLGIFQDSSASVSCFYISLNAIYDSIKSLRNCVFEGNVRYFDRSSKINQSIIKTLTEDDCSKFHLLNNGLTIVCNKLICSCINEKIDIKKGSIINGAQTVGCILSVFDNLATNSDSNNLLKKLNNSYLFLKVIQIDNQHDLVDKLVYTLNTQNSMKSSYCISNNPKVKDIQNKINSSTCYFLQLKKNEFNHQKLINKKFNKLPKNIIDIELAVQCFVCFYNINNLGFQAKNNKSSLFNDENIEYIIADLNSETIIKTIILFKLIMKYVYNYRSYRKDSKKDQILSDLSISVDEIDDYKYLNTGNFIILFSLGCFERKTNKDSSKYVASVIKTLSKLFRNESNIANLTRSKEKFDEAENAINSIIDKVTK